jgi:hypothetical protein
MHALPRFCVTAAIVCAAAMSAAGQGSSARAQTELTQALTGHWVGVLEYRDYSEPPSSTRRVQLPTWLNIQPASEGLRYEYVYDDGPGKVVKSQDVVVIDSGAKTYKVVDADAASDIYTIAGLEALKDGRGELVLSCPGTENDKPAEIRITLTVRRNLLTFIEETRQAGSKEPFAFRHRYVMTRAQPPGSETPPH